MRLLAVSCLSLFFCLFANETMGSEQWGQHEVPPFYWTRVEL